MKSNEAIQIKKKKEKGKHISILQVPQNRKIELSNKLSNYDFPNSRWNQSNNLKSFKYSQKKQIINNFKCKWGLSIRPEMKSTWNQISIHHKGSSVHTTFHCGRNKMKFRFTAGRRKAAHSVKEHHFYFDEIDVCANVLIHMINFW